MKCDNCGSNLTIENVDEETDTCTVCGQTIIAVPSKPVSPHTPREGYSEY